MQICKVCSDKEAIYCCPRCSIRTCSLQCVTIHKKNTECSGKRNVTSYISLQEFNEANLKDDINFLESTAKRAKSDDSVRYSVLNKPAEHLNCNKMVLAKLSKAASLRNIEYRLAPFLTARRKSNSTFCNCNHPKKVNSSTKMFWHVRWVLNNRKVEDRKVDEDLKIKEMLENLMNQNGTESNETLSFTKPLSGSLQSKTLIEKGDCVSELTSRLLFRSEFEQAFGGQFKTGGATLASICIGMLAEHLNQPKAIYLFDQNKTLRDNLDGKVVVEHPILLLIPSSAVEEYTLI